MKEKELQRQAVLDAIQDLNVKFREKIEASQDKYAEMWATEDVPYTNREWRDLSAERKGISAMYSIFMDFCEKKIWLHRKANMGQIRL